MTEPVVIGITQSGDRLATIVRYRKREAESSHPIEFDREAGLPAIAKALNRGSYLADDFKVDQLAFLTQLGYLATAGNGGAQSFVPDLAERVGESLFGALFSSGDQEGIYTQARAESATGVHFRLEFSADADVVGGLPWELIWHSGDFLIAGGRGTLSRHLIYDDYEPTGDLLGIDQLRVLVVAPRPPGVAALGFEELNAIEGVASTSGAMKVDVLQRASISGLADYLEDHAHDGAPHVIHIDCHGVYGRRCQDRHHISPRGAAICVEPGCPAPTLDKDAQGYLAWFGPDCRDLEFVSARRLADELSHFVSGNDSALRVVVVSACRSAAATGSASVFSGVAQSLIKAHVPAVVGMQFAIGADQAVNFAYRLYRNLAQGTPLLECTARARTGLGLDGGDWYRPVLYLRASDASDGAFFKIEPRSSVVNAAPPNAAVRVSEVATVDAAKVEAPAGDNAATQPSAPTDTELIAAASRGLDTLRGLLTDSAVRSHALPFTGPIESVSRQLARVGDYKEIHDELHTLRYQFANVVRDEIDLMEGDERARTRIDKYQDVLEFCIESIRSIVERGRLTLDDFTWIDDLDHANDDLTTGLRETDKRYIEWAYDALCRVLDFRPTEINVRLDDAARELRLANIAEALAAARSALGQSAAGDDAQRLDNGASAFRAEARRLADLVGQHTRWQGVEPELRLARDSLAGGRASFARTWTRLRDRLNAMYSASGETWAARLGTECRQLDERLMGQEDDDAIGRSFTNCESEAGRRFYEVDRQLKSLCTALQPLGGQLEGLISALGTQSGVLV